MIIATRHTGIVVRDMERCLIFWRDIMGMKVIADFREKGGFIDRIQKLDGVDLHMIKLSAPDGSVIELLKDSTNHIVGSQPQNAMELELKSLCELGIRHIAFTVENIAKAWNILCDSGCEVLSEHIAAPNGKAMVFFCRDPEGNLLEIVEEL